MIPFLLIGGGALLIIDSLGKEKATFDPIELGLPTKGFRGYKKSRNKMAMGGQIKNYKQFKSKLEDIAQNSSSREEFSKSVKEDETLVKKIPIYFQDMRRDLGVTDNQWRIYMSKPGQYTDKIQAVSLESMYDKIKTTMAKGGFSKSISYANTPDGRKISKVGEFKYVLVSKTGSNLNKWSNSKEKLEKEIEFLKKNNFPDEVSIVETTIKPYYADGGKLANPYEKFAKGGKVKNADELSETNKELVKDRGFNVGDTIKFFIGEKGNRLSPYKEKDGYKIIGFIEKGKHKDLYVKTMPLKGSGEGPTIDYYSIIQKMAHGGETSLVGKRIRLIKMENDPHPVEPGTMGTIKHVGGGVYNVDWDNGRTLGVVEGEDQYEIIN